MISETPPDALPSAGVFAGGEHRLAVRVYYEDTDFTGLVYHASYVRFLERGRSDFLRLAGADHRAMGELGAAFVVVRLELDFRRVARIDDALVVTTRLAPIQGARMMFSQRVERDGQAICAAEVTVACIADDGRARRLPRALVAILEQSDPA